jgi:hypothetical protein
LGPGAPAGPSVPFEAAIVETVVSRPAMPFVMLANIALASCVGDPASSLVSKWALKPLAAPAD